MYFSAKLNTAVLLYMHGKEDNYLFILLKSFADNIALHYNKTTLTEG